MSSRTIETTILEAASNNDDALNVLLREAMETMEETQFDLLAEKVHQILHEKVCDVYEWKNLPTD